ncbi:MAG: hypothetical protein VX910_01515 [Candidatus Latescibacterota bacterium]|nr:hypothetical protein [Candidatus Latescibacterota bacterium]
MTIKATVPLTDVPEWAVLQQKLISVMEEAVYPFLEKYTHPDGRIIWKEGIHNSRDGADDFYESFYNWPLLYLLGGGDHLLELGQRQWDATTRLMEDMGHVHKEYEIGYDQFHQSESYIYFYLLCMADPENELNVNRAQRFAGFFIGEDQDAPNYDSANKIIRCAHNGSKGPRWTNEADQTPSHPYSPGMAVYGLPFEDIEGIKTFEDLKDPELAGRMGQAMKERTAKGDVAANLHVCSLITNAYLLTNDKKYKDWLLEYVDAWMKRASENGGLLPDNVGLNGQVGQYMNGKWFGGRYGWSWPHGFYNIGMAAILAGVQCFLLTRDEKYLELPRTQIREIMSLGKMADLNELADQMSLQQHWQAQFDAIAEEESAETWVVPYRYLESGWFDYQPMSLMYPTAVWNVFGASEDWQIIEEVQAKETYDWRKVSSFRLKEDAGHEQPWVSYLQGDNPDYPVKILQASLAQVYRRMEQIRQDETDPRNNHIHWWQQLNPVTTEALIQLTLGAPQLLYNGGLLHAPWRYSDRERKRPGLPQGVSALVEKVEAELLEVILVNTSAIHSRQLTVQAGTLREHQFTDLTFDVISSDYPDIVGSYSAPPTSFRKENIRIDDVDFEVDLPAGTQIRLRIGQERCVNDPSYRQPDFITT